MTNSRVVAYKSWMALPLRFRILAEPISIASTSLQQRQSISLALFLQCPIPICNKSAVEREYV